MASRTTNMQVEKIQAQRAVYEQEISALKAKVEAIDDVLKLLVETEGEVERSKPKRGTTKAIILELLESSGVGGTDADKIVEVAALRGITLRRNTVSSQLSRLKSDGVIYLDEEDKLYRLSEHRPRPERFKVFVHDL